MLAAAFSPSTRNSRSNLVTKVALLVEQLLLLLIEIDKPLFLNFKHLVGPKCAADMNIHVILVRNESPSDRPLSLLFAEEADERALRIGDRNVFHAADKRLLGAIIVSSKAPLF